MYANSTIFLYLVCPGNQVAQFDQFTKIFRECVCPAALSKFDKASQRK